jgi:hypothetical protein
MRACRAEGGELFERVVNGSFPEQTAKLFFYQLLMAIQVRLYMKDPFQLF